MKRREKDADDEDNRTDISFIHTHSHSFTHSKESEQYLGANRGHCEYLLCSGNQLPVSLSPS